MKGFRKGRGLRDCRAIPGVERGFTLFELLIVLVIIGLMSAVIVPALGHSIENSELRAATRDVASIFRFARSRAVSEKSPYVAIYSEEERRLVLFSEALLDLYSQQRDKEYELQPRPACIYEFPRGIRLQRVAEEGGAEEGRTDLEEESGLEIIRFFPTGASSGGIYAILAPGGRQAMISVDAITGIVDIS